VVRRSRELRDHRGDGGSLARRRHPSPVRSLCAIRAIRGWPSWCSVVQRAILNVRSCAILCDPVRSCAILRDPARSCAILRDPARSCAILRDPARSCAILCDPVRSCAILRDPALSGTRMFGVGRNPRCAILETSAPSAVGRAGARRSKGRDAPRVDERTAGKPAMAPIAAVGPPDLLGSSNGAGEARAVIRAELKQGPRTRHTSGVGPADDPGGRAALLKRQRS